MRGWRGSCMHSFASFNWDHAACVLCFLHLVQITVQSNETADVRRTSTVEIPLGIYGPITSVSTTFLATAVAFDLDFRKNFDQQLQTRFGPPVVSIPNLNPNLRIKVQIGTSNSDPEVGVSTNLDFLLGRNGFTQVAGIVGGYHSAISMPVASLASVLKAPQVSWGSTSPKLSNKATYPFFCRTIPPDSIQGAGMWQFIIHFKVPSVSFLYAQEPYGEGLFTTVANLASAANQGYRVTGVGVRYMPSDSFDMAEVRTKIAMVKTAGHKIIFMGMTSDQASPCLYVMQEEGMLQQPWQIVGSEGVKIGPHEYMPKDGFPIGFLRFNPMSKGPLFSKFDELWTKMKADDAIGTAAKARYSLDLFKVPLDQGKAAVPTDDMFASTSNMQLEDPFLFDAAYTFAIAFNEMLNDGEAVADIKGQKLLDKVRAIKFEGISGIVAFNDLGDRLASYTIDNIQADPNNNGAKDLVTAGTFNAATDKIVLDPSAELIWIGGKASSTIPDFIVACDAGYFTDSELMCRPCEAGSLSLGGAGATCTRCLGGTRANAKIGATACIECNPGNFSEPGSIECKECPIGTFAERKGMGECATCPTGKFQDETGQTACKFREIAMGIYGPITSVSTTFLASAVAFEIDFRKNFEPEIAKRFGPPIIKMPNLNQNLRIKLLIGNSNSEPDAGVGLALDMFLGKGVPKIAGLVGGYHSAICMPIASLAAELKVPQISWGCTSPKLSNKDVYPYFSRAVPPDSIQGAGMWQFIVQLEVPAVTFMFAGEPYGQGLYDAVSELATGSNQAFRVVGVSIKYMPKNYDLEEAQKKVDVAKALGNKFIFLGMTPDQVTPLAYLMEKSGMFSNKWQLVGSEGVVLKDMEPAPPKGFPDGFIRFNPISKGPLYPKFEELWKKLTPEDIMGTAAYARYRLDKFQKPLDEADGELPSDEMFADSSKMNMFDAFIVDSSYALVMAFNRMLNDNVGPESIAGQPLLDEVRAASFEGITGFVQFNDHGDRLASYEVCNIQSADAAKSTQSADVDDSNTESVANADNGAHNSSSGNSADSSNSSRRLLHATVESETNRRLTSVGNEIVVGEYSAVANKISFKPGKALQWMDGTYGQKIPESLVACDEGFYQDASRLCRPCAAGTYSLGGAGVQCERCPKGSTANKPTRATGCTNCAAGKYASETGLTICSPCVAGSISVVDGARSCTFCAEGYYGPKEGGTSCYACANGTFSAAKGQTVCKNCSLGFVAPFMNSSRCDTCALGKYQDTIGQRVCKPCPSNQNTEVRGAEGIFECKCVPGMYRDNPDSPCKPCPNGMSCAYGSDMSLYRQWNEGGRIGNSIEGGDFPRLTPHHSALATDPLNVYWCRDENRCPGGPPGTCGPRLDLTIISCAACEDQWYWNGQECSECSAFEVSSVLFPVLPLLLGPLVVVGLYIMFRDDLPKWGSWQNGGAALCFILLNHYQITTLASNANLQYPKDSADYFASWEFTDDLISMFKPQCAGFASFEKTMVVRSLGPIIMAAAFVLVYLCSMMAKLVFGKHELGMNLDRTLNIYFSVILTFFAGIASMCIMIFKCHDNPNGKRTLSKDEGIICGEETWNNTLGVAIACIFVYIIGFGGVFVWAIFQAPQRFHDVSFQRRWKFLFIKYRPDVWWWTCAFCAKGVLMNLGFVFLDTGISQLNWIMGISGVYCCLSIFYMPWRHRGANLVEIYAHVGLMFVISLLTWYAHDAVDDPETIGRDISKAVIVINVSPMLAALPVFLFMLRTQLHPSPRQQLANKAMNFHNCCSVLANAGEPSVHAFMERLTDWDKFYMLKAYEVIRIEFPVEDVQQSSSKLRLSGSSSNLSVSSGGSTGTPEKKRDDSPQEQARVESTNSDESHHDESSASSKKKKVITPRVELPETGDFPLESHATPRAGRAARTICQARTPQSSPRTEKAGLMTPPVTGRSVLLSHR